MARSDLKKQASQHLTKGSKSHNLTAIDSVGRWTKCNFAMAFLLALFCGFLNRYHVANMFENDRHFSYLSDLEREMTFRTEMGLYFSYYKTLIGAPSLSSGLNSILRDNVTEFGHTINTLKRFNLYPELVLAIMYRTYKNLANKFHVQTQTCWKTERGQDMEPILSCEGMGNAAYFYVNHVFVLSGIVAATLFLFGTLISNSLLGGLISCAAFFFNHGEATRVQWTPPLRESFGYPFFLVLLLVITLMIKYDKYGKRWIFSISCLTVCFMTSWQFASFGLSVVVGCAFLVYVLDYVSAPCLRCISTGLLIGLCVSYILLFGNEMLLTSLFLSSLIALHIIVSSDRLVKKLNFRLLIVVVQIAIFATGTLLIKFGAGWVLQVEDDAHIFDILRSKLTNYSDFHTKLYTCAAEFDFMAIETPWKLSITLLLPSAFLGLIIAFVIFLQGKVKCVTDLSPNGSLKAGGEILFNSALVLAFTVMAVMIMRLKLFFTPQLCIIAALLANSQHIRSILGRYYNRQWHQALCFLLIAIMGVIGVNNLKQQFSIMGEYSNPMQENLFQWILKETAPDAVFAGPMPTMANLKLSTNRPIVNHPHYEDVGIRERTKKVYGMFSRKSHRDVYDDLKNIGVNYFVFQYGWCSKTDRSGCSMPELYDLDDVENRGKEALCDKIERRKFGPFKLAYENPHYKVLQL